MSKSKNDSNRVDLLNELSYTTYLNLKTSSQNENLIKSYIDSAIVLSQKLNYYKGNIRARFIAGNIYKNYGKTEIAKNYLRDGLSICEILKQPSAYSKIYNTLGICFMEEGNYKVAVDYLFKAIKSAEESGDKSLILTSLNSVGNLYKNQGEFEKAIHYYIKSLRYAKETNNRLKMSFSYVNLGTAYLNLKKHDSSLYYFNNALKIQTADKNIGGQAISYLGIGDVYLDRKFPRAAIDYFKRSKNLLNGLNEAEGEIRLLIKMGEALFQIDDLNNSLDYYLQAVKKCKETKKLPELGQSYFGLASVYHKKNDDKSAYKYFIEYTSIKDSINSSSVSKKLASLEYNLQIEQDKKIQKLEKQRISEKHEEEVKKQKLIIYFFSIVFLILCVFLFLIFRSNKQKSLAYRTISLQKQEVENKNRIIEEKQKEILDSIHYAKRIQKALLPNETFFTRVLKNKP
ncbi:MAG: tetratricopeptide repeat protein [Bacteroidota bacterium]|nr:tetratricopeptide repeat protein [Bacteroidota bacterium]